MSFDYKNVRLKQSAESKVNNEMSYQFVVDDLDNKNNIFVTEAKEKLKKQQSRIDKILSELNENKNIRFNNLISQEIIAFIIGLSALTVLFFSPWFIKWLGLSLNETFVYSVPLGSLYLLFCFLVLIFIRKILYIKNMSKKDEFIKRIKSIQKELNNIYSNVDSIYLELFENSKLENRSFKTRSRIESSIDDCENQSRIHYSNDSKVWSYIIKGSYIGVVFALFIGFIAILIATDNELLIGASSLLMMLYVLIAIVIFMRLK